MRGRVDRSSVEARWFVPADLARELRPEQTGRCRADSYHLPSLAPDVSVKWRGDADVVERKRRLGRVELVEWCGVVGFAEQWVKRRRPAASPRGDGWCDVTKEVWDDAGVELARIDVGGAEFWTVCIDPGRAVEPPGTVRRAWARLLAQGEPASYAAFLAACPAVGLARPAAS